MIAPCVGCGLPAKVIGNDEGTYHYEPIYDSRKTAVRACSVCGRNNTLLK